MGEMVESDLSKFPPRTNVSEPQVELSQDFSDGLSPAEIELKASAAIGLLAHFDAYAKQWARANGKDARLVDAIVRKSDAVKLMMDLANFDKHAGHNLRRPTHTGRRPTLREVARALRLTTGPKSNSGVTVRGTSEGVSVLISGQGSAEVVIDADIVDETGVRIGGLHDTMKQAVDDWASLLKVWGFQLPNSLWLKAGRGRARGRTSESG